jgi:hypothetical protein
MATVNELLTELNGVKNDIKNALIDKGVDMTGVPFTEYAEKVADAGEKSSVIVLSTNGSGGSSNSHIIVEEECNCALNQIVWAEYICKNSDDARSFGHCLKVDVSTDNGATYTTVCDQSISADAGVSKTYSFNPEGVVYNKVKIEFWNATGAYNCGGCAVVYQA